MGKRGRPIKDLEGERFGRLLVTELVPRDEWGDHRASWQCICECGRLTVVPGHLLTSGNTKSCGCSVAVSRHNRAPNLKHGHMSGGHPSPEYSTWLSMKERCNNPHSINYANYGGRGIKLNFETFDDFFHEVGKRPPGTSIDRIDNDGHYEPGNVRWATRTQQRRNQRTRCKVTEEQVAELLAMRQRGMTLYAIADHFGVHNSVVHRYCKRNGFRVRPYRRRTTS